MQIWQIEQGTTRNTNKRGSQQVSTPSPIPMRCSLRWCPLTNAFRIPVVIRRRQTQFRRIRRRRRKREALAWNARACPCARTPVFVRSDFKGGRGGGGPSGSPNETGSMSDPGTPPGCPKCKKSCTSKEMATFWRPFSSTFIGSETVVFKGGRHSQGSRNMHFDGRPSDTRFEPAVLAILP